MAVLATVIGVAPAAARPKPGVKRSASDLFALTAAILQVNHQYCPVINTGTVCTDPTGSGVIEGGFWPKGTPDSYIFNSGLQIGGVIPASAGFSWAGDTVGAFFMDPRGTQQDGAPITLVYNSLDPSDAANWAGGDVAGQVTDTSLYSNVLLGRNAVSQQDLWFRSWDGNPTKLGGRDHPMGILVETRGMAWNYPVGNADIIYFVYTFTNVTSAVTADYVNSTIPNPSPAYAAGLSAIGAQFQQLNNSKFGINIPLGGYEIDNVFAAFFEDCDVGTDNVANNYSTAIFPFAMGACYEAPFFEPKWSAAGSFTDQTIFGPPFLAGPGFTSVKYLKSPVNPVTGSEFGIVMFSNTLNQATGFPDPVGVKQMYRYLSGTASPAAGDNPCSFPAPGQAAILHFCYLAQTSADTRFFESSGPFTLLPGHASTIVVAYVNAAAVNTPYLQTQINGDFKPGFSATGDSIYVNPPAKVRPIEQVMGWAGPLTTAQAATADINGDQIIEQNEVSTVPRSLLNKALVAQNVFDNKFLLPFSPDAPKFFLIPGDNQVTIVWQKSNSEVTGDPYFAVAQNPLQAALYDPDFRQFDVEGYRIYRGRTAGAMQLVAQFDYAGTSVTDYTAQFVDANFPNCAPELGLYQGPADVNPVCAVHFDSIVNLATSASVSVDLVGPVVQVPPGGRVKLADGTIFNVTLDTATTGFLPLTDGGVPFAFVDRGVRNLFQYFYSVTAFDVNSAKSEPPTGSLESAQVTQTVTPRAAGANQVAAGATVVQLQGSDGVALNPAAANPALDPVTGEFAGPQPPTAAFAITGLQVFADQLIIPNYQANFVIDSVVPMAYHTGIYYMSEIAGIDTTPIVLDPAATGNAFALGQENGDITLPFGALIPADTTKTGAVGLTGLPLAGKLAGAVTVHPNIWNSSVLPFTVIGANVYFGTPASMPDAGGSRWFDGANESTPDPTLLDGSGALTGVTKIYEPTPAAGNPEAYAKAGAIYRRYYQTLMHAARAADMKVYWGTTPGTVDSVMDVTHHVAVPFSPNYRASWGFLRDYNGATQGTVSPPNGIMSQADALQGPCLPNVAVALGGVDQTGCATRLLANTAVLMPTDVTGDEVADGQGFGMYINTEPFFFETATLPSKPTVWTLRTYSGVVSQTGGVYSFLAKPSDPPVPGLTLVAKTTTAATYPQTGTFDLTRVHTVPDPYYVTSALEITPTEKVLKFVNLPSQCIVRIYSVSGVLVQVLTHNDPQGGGELAWDLRSRSNQFVASGVYFYHVEAANHQTKVGRFTVVQFAP